MIKYKAINKDIIARIEILLDQNIVKPIHTSCWIWYGQRDRYGYGVINTHDGHFFIHRIMYETFVGPIGDHQVIRHSCDNPSCCNPDHLIPGTQANNIADAIQRGRTARGERVKGAKLTKEKVLNIRNKFSGKRGDVANLAREHEVNPETIRMIVTRKSWKHV